MLDIRTQKLIYHLTSLQNLPPILERGLQPRADLANFVDVADQDIITDRRRLRLERFVPFHFFAKNPFDGRVQRDHPEKRFVLIAVERSKARSLGWKIIPRHPLAGDDIEVMDYDAGMQALDKIDWPLLQRRDFKRDPEDPGKLERYQAEALVHQQVPLAALLGIVCYTEAVQADIERKMRSQALPPPVHARPNWYFR